MGVMFAGLRIGSTFSVPDWDGKRLGKALQYWRAHGFRDVALDSDGVIRGTRGSWRTVATFRFPEGTDSDWRDTGVGTLPTRLEMSTEADKTVRVQLKVQRWPFRRSGEWEAALFRLEIIQLQHLLLGTEMDAEVWGRFRKAAKRFFGRELPTELEAEISDLEVRLLFTP